MIEDVTNTPTVSSMPEHLVSSIPVAPPQTPVSIKTLDELMQACNKPFDVTVNIDGQAYAIPCRRLTPAESSQIALILEEVLPAQQMSQDGKEPQYTVDTATRKKMVEANRDAMAMTVYLGCPMYRENKPGMTNRKDIREFVDSVLSEQVVTAIYNAIVGGNVSVQAYTNFF